MNRRASWLMAVLTALVSSALLLPARTDDQTAQTPPSEKPVDFVRDIRPILSDNCFKCHGPDEKERKAKLRLDVRDAAIAERDGGAAIVPGHPEKSTLIERLTTDDPEAVMPPPKTGKKLTPQQIDLLKNWIRQGASYVDHWAFVPPKRPPVPRGDETGGLTPSARATGGLTPSAPNNAIDLFIRDRLRREGLRPSPEADKATLLRRLSLDLIGLPPTPEELDAFLSDESPDAYERQVERLLASPHYGERWGRHWLDAARYADSDGFEKDKPRFVWAYRDWVIAALNRDLPYDQFIIEQLAGDLLARSPASTASPLPPSDDPRVATGFLRNSMINEEGGIDPEQFRMEAMFDRMDAIGKSILGLTIQCAQCHNHKYDPITQEDYYGMFAFLNNDHEASVPVYSADDQRRRALIFEQIRRIEQSLKERHPNWRERLANWEAEQKSRKQPTWHIVRPELDGSGGQKHYLLDDGSILAAGYAPTKHTTEFEVKTPLTTITAVRLELLNDPNLPLGGPGRSIFGTCALTEFKLVAAPADDPGKRQEVKIVSATADVNPPERELDRIFDDNSKRRRVTGPIEYAIDGKDETAWTIELGPGRSNVPREAVFVLEKPISFPSGAFLIFKLVQNHGGWNSDDNQNNNLGRFRFSVTDASDAVADPVPRHVRTILEIPAELRSESQWDALFSYWRTTVPEWSEENQAIEQLWQQHPRGSWQLTLQPREMPRDTRFLDRGDFLKPKHPIKPGVPSVLHPLPGDADASRLAFARWLVDRRSPTTARALVNRVWQTYFGTGLVATSEDFGLQSEPPSHPELLDWLAVEFMDSGWSLKHLHRLIVTSATYWQSSKTTPEHLEKDPQNRLLARMPRLRVEAEVVRDIALSTSGLLDRKIGGPSVFPPAPSFLFVPPASYGPKVWKEETGPDRYRRALYTFRFRSVPYPALQAFDAPNGDFACVKRVRSNTPLQALTTLNEPLFLECAAGLAERTLREGGECDADRIRYAFRLCTARGPSDRELQALTDLLHRQREHYRQGKGDARGLLASARVTLDPQGPEDIAERAAWVVVSRVLLNLDETITRE
jgi:mono/diheme cytochrome c family protein